MASKKRSKKPWKDRKKKRRWKDIIPDDSILRMSVHNTVGKYFAEEMLGDPELKRKEFEDYFNVNIQGGQSGQILPGMKSPDMSAALARKPVKVTFLEIIPPKGSDK